jgi:hypothetical protein
MKFNLTINCDNAAFRASEGNVATEVVADMLRKIADAVDGGSSFSINHIPVRDPNGNTVGEYGFTRR